MDCCLIPFLCNTLTKSIYPLKINEYLSAGIPTVLTDFSDLSDFKDTTQIVTNKTDFLSAIQKELAEDNIEKQHLRAQIGQQNSWENRADEISEIIALMRKVKSVTIE